MVVFGVLLNIKSHYVHIRMCVLIWKLRREYEVNITNAQHRDNNSNVHFKMD